MYVSILKKIEKVKILKPPVWFKLMTLRFVEKPLTHFASLLDDGCGKETIDKITLNFFLFNSINSTSQNKGVPYYL